jgi:hypothetical protein
MRIKVVTFKRTVTIQNFTIFHLRFVTVISISEIFLAVMVVLLIEILKVQEGSHLQ